MGLPLSRGFREMSKIKVPQTLTNIEEKDDLVRYVSQTLMDVVSTLNGGISISENLDSRIVGVTFTAANMNVIVNHKLNRVPVGYWPVTRTSNITVFDGTSPNTSSVLNIQASGAGGVKLLIF